MTRNRHWIPLLLALSVPAWACAEETAETTAGTTVETTAESVVEVKAENKVDNKGPGNQAFRLPKTIELTAEQVTSLAALKTELAPQLAALALKQQEVLTPAQRAARKQAMADAKTQGKRGKELREAVDAATEMSEQQRTDLKAAQSEMRTLSAAVREKVLALLTQEQRDKLPAQKPAKAKTNKKAKQKPETTTDTAPASTPDAPEKTDSPATIDNP